MKTLDEAIQHALDIAEINENIAENTDHENWMDIGRCEKCAEEHRQLAEWLKELQEYKRIKGEVIRIANRLNESYTDYVTGYVHALSRVEKMMTEVEQNEQSD